MVICPDKGKIQTIIQFAVSFVDRSGVIGNQTALGLPENLIQYGNRHKAAVDQLQEYTARAYTLQLVGVAYQQNLGARAYPGKELMRQPHIHHRTLVHNEQVSL